jgi:hypothetical protein
MDTHFSLCASNVKISNIPLVLTIKSWSCFVLIYLLCWIVSIIERGGSGVGWKWKDEQYIPEALNISWKQVATWTPSPLLVVKATCNSNIKFYIPIANSLAVCLSVWLSACSSGHESIYPGPMVTRTSLGYSVYLVSPLNHSITYQHYQVVKTNTECL